LSTFRKWNAQEDIFKPNDSSDVNLTPHSYEDAFGMNSHFHFQPNLPTLATAFMTCLVTLLCSCSMTTPTNPGHSTSQPKAAPVPMPLPDSLPTPPPAPEGGYTYLALGDSYTIGESVPEKDRWSVQLADLLRQEGLPVQPPDIIARTGWTTDELAQAIRTSGNTRKYEMVSLLIGVNNQYRSQSKDKYRQELADLLRTATDFANGNAKRVFVLSIPDWGVTPFASDRDQQKIATEIDAFNAIAKEECTRAGIEFIDITPLSRTARNDASMVADDRLHFSGKMYRLWAEKALPTVLRLLRP
jgi:lysophospholipase L1-like esterase